MEGAYQYLYTFERLERFDAKVFAVRLYIDMVLHEVRLDSCPSYHILLPKLSANCPIGYWFRRH